MADIIPAGTDMAAFMVDNSPAEIGEDEFITEAVRLERMLGKTDQFNIAFKLLRGWHLDKIIPESREDAYGNQSVERFADRIHDETGMRISRSTLYEERKVYLAVRKKMVVRVRSPFENVQSDRRSEKAIWIAFWNWYRNRRSDFGERVYWTHVKRWATDNSKDQSKILGSQEDAKKKALGKLEQGLIEVANYVEQHGEDEEIVGMLSTTKDTLEDYYELEETGPTKKIKPVEEDDYHEFIKQQLCVVTGADPEAVTVDPSHLSSGIMGGKMPWLLAVPLEHSLHQEFHNIGVETFTEKYRDLIVESDQKSGKLDPIWYRVLFNLYYLYQYGKTFDLDFSF